MDGWMDSIDSCSCDYSSCLSSENERTSRPRPRPMASVGWMETAVQSNAQVMVCLHMENATVVSVGTVPTYCSG